MAVRQETKTRWVTSSGVEYPKLSEALISDAVSLACEFRNGPEVKTATELRDALNAYLDHFTPEGDLMVNVNELRQRLLNYSADTTDPMYKHALAALRGELVCKLTHLQTKLDAWHVSFDPVKTRDWRNWVIGHAKDIVHKSKESAEAKPVTSGATAVAMHKVSLERERQESLKKVGKIPFTCADDGVDAGRRLAVLTEEVGEVAREICDGNTTTLETQHKLKTELVQVAAVAVAWVEFLDRLT